MLSLYREQLKAMARSLDQEGLSQTAVAKELGIDQSTVSRWLTNNSRQGDLHNSVSVMQNALPKTRYLVVCDAVEKFCPLDGITFPLIIADPPWNISTPSGEIRRKARRTSVKKNFGLWDSYASEDAYLLAEQVSAGNPQLFHHVTIGLEELGITRIQSHRWQRLHDIPEEHLARYIAECGEEDGN